MKNSYTNNAKVFKAFCDENRLKILEILQKGEKCACSLLAKLDISQSTLSHHMKVLCDSGIVQSEKNGKWTHYKINPSGCEYAKTLLDELTKMKFAKKIVNKDDEFINLYMLTGFLGSGKTTILSNLLNKINEERIGVIQNEFGKVSIDGEILRNDNIKMVEINRGSIFCSCLKLSFVDALNEMSKQNLKYLFVESSGLGDPSNMDEILSATKELCGDKYKFKGTICLIDAVNFLDNLNDIETVYRQLKHCNIAVITKVDLVDEFKITQLKEKIRQINPICDIDVSSNGNLNLDFLNKDLMKYSWAESEETTNTKETKPKTISLNFYNEIDKDSLEKFINNVKQFSYRIKGFFNLKDYGWKQIDVVGNKIDYKSCDKKDKSELIFISKIGPEIIRKVFNSWNENIDEKMELKN